MFSLVDFDFDESKVKWLNEYFMDLFLPSDSIRNFTPSAYRMIPTCLKYS